MDGFVGGKGNFSDAITWTGTNLIIKNGDGVMGMYFNLINGGAIFICFLIFVVVVILTLAFALCQILTIKKEKYQRL